MMPSSATKPAARATVERKRPAARGVASQGIERTPKSDEPRRDQVHVVHAEEDEDLDWLNEDEDPRSQIVEDEEDDWSPQHDDEW